MLSALTLQTVMHRDSVYVAGELLSELLSPKFLCLRQLLPSIERPLCSRISQRCSPSSAPRVRPTISNSTSSIWSMGRITHRRIQSEDTTSLFCQMIAQLSQLSEYAQPTAFHRFLRVLDDRRRLLRVYTQNIDALEEKSGLTFGVPELEGKRYKPRSAKGKAAAVDAPAPAAPATDEPSTSRLPSPPVETPKCIPLHGTLQLMHCQTCRHSYPLRDYIDSLTSGTPPDCPQCTALEATRQLIGKRSRGVGRLRPSVVLYNEDHKDGEEVGDVVRKDLMRSSKGKGRAGADLLLVVGTSLRVPGTKRIVREFSKAVRSRHAAMNTPADEPSTSAHGLVTPTPSPRRSPAEDEEPPVRTIYLNLDFPVPTREWEGVFDVWIRGDAQEFARMVHEELEREEQAKEAVKERRRRKEEAAAEVARQAEEQERAQAAQGDRQGGSGQTKKAKKRKEQPSSENGEKVQTQPAKKRKMGGPPLSPVSPPSKSRHKDHGKEKIKGTAKARRRDETLLPTPPNSEDDPQRLVIKVPARLPRPEVVITTPVKRNRQVYEPSSSPLSSPPSSPPVLSRVPSTSTEVSSPPHSDRAHSYYDMSGMSNTLSDISMSPSPSPLLSHPTTPRKVAPSLSCVARMPSSPLTPTSSSSQEPSPPHTPAQAQPKRRKTSHVARGDPGKAWLAHRSGSRPQLRLHRYAVDDSDRSAYAYEGEPESRWPELYVWTVPG